MPIVFISYSHDSAAHKDWILSLASDLRTNGVDARLDQWDLAPGQDISLFMQRGVTDSDRVLMVCTSAYVEKAEAGIGGVGFERLIVTEELVKAIDTKKFLPIVRGASGASKIPKFLGPRLYLDFSDDAAYATQLEALLRDLLDAPATPKPPLGKNPFSGSAPPLALPARVTGPTGIAALSGQPVLDDDWFKTESEKAWIGLAKATIPAYMEIRSALHHVINASQIALLEGVQRSEIRTFGWPIAVLLNSRAEYRPRPYGDGIRAEVAIPKEDRDGRASYDYWALRSNGDFYLMQSLFEDARAEKRIFFNTRIVRVTEALMFVQRLYEQLGAPPEILLTIRVTHWGLAGRMLSGVGNRLIFDKRFATDNVAQAELTVALGDIRAGLVKHVQKLTSGMFMLFDFQEFATPVYEDIVRRFEGGEVS